MHLIRKMRLKCCGNGSSGFPILCKLVNKGACLFSRKRPMICPSKTIDRPLYGVKNGTSGLTVVLPKSIEQSSCCANAQMSVDSRQNPWGIVSKLELSFRPCSVMMRRTSRDLNLAFLGCRKASKRPRSVQTSHSKLSLLGIV